MSEVVNVEEDGPEIVPDPAPVAEVVPEAAAPEAEPDEVEVSGQRLVPVSAVIAERKQRQAVQARAAQADELEAYVRDAKPWVEFLKANPDILKPRQAPAPPTTFGTPADPQAEDYAKTLDLYTPEGKPDVDRANKIRAANRAEVNALLQQHIGPIHEKTHQDASARNFQIALTYKDPQGRSPSPQSLAAIWRTMSAQQSADPNVASILTLTALGLDAANYKPQPAAPGQPPIVTEGSGGAPRRPALSALEASIARERGVTEAKWAENTSGFVKGRPQQLED